MKPHTAAAILAVVDAEGLPRTKEKAEPVIRAWLRAHDAKVDRWGSYHLSDGKRVKFQERVVRIEEKDQYGWRLRQSDSYVDMALTLAKKASEAAGRGDILRKAEKTRGTRKAASERGAASRKAAYEIKNGPGYYVTNGYTGSGLKMRHADHDKPFLSLDSAIEMAKKKYAELVGMKFTYLLPVQVVKTVDRQHAEHPMIGVLSRDGKTELLWQDGHKVVHEDPNQVRLPGMASGARDFVPGQPVEVHQIWASNGAVKDPSKRWSGGYVFVGHRRVRGQNVVVVRNTKGVFAGMDSNVSPLDVRHAKGHCCGFAGGAKKAKRLTLAEAKAQVRPLGFSLKSLSSAGMSGEYVLTPLGEREGSKSYYTNDLQDAVDTARSQGHCCGFAGGAKKLKKHKTIYGDAVVSTYTLALGPKGRAVSRKASKVVFEDGHEVKFTEVAPARVLIPQAVALRKKGR